MADEPADWPLGKDGRVLESLDVLDRLELADLAGVQVARVEDVERDVVAEERVGAEPTWSIPITSTQYSK